VFHPLIRVIPQRAARVVGQHGTVKGIVGMDGGDALRLIVRPGRIHHADHSFIAIKCGPAIVGLGQSLHAAHRHVI